MISRIPGGLVVLVALSSAVSVAVAALPIVSRLSAADEVWTAATRPAVETVAAIERADLSPIMDFAPFGRAAVQTAPADAGAAGPVLTLQGVSTSPNRSDSRAIIAGGEGQVASYAIGDRVASDVVLTDIATDHVILDSGGEAQRLDFPTDAAAAPGISAEAPTFSTDLQNLIPTAQPASVGLAGTIMALRDELQRNPQAVLDRYGITATGKGYLIGDTTPAAVLEIGLQPGDLVTELNGRKVGVVLSDRSLLDEVAASGQAEIVLLRSGEPVALSVPFQ